MKREIYHKLLAWKTSKKRKPLLLKGARQVGKTWLIEEFGREEFSQVHTFNFQEDPELHSVFQASLNPMKILETLELSYSVTISLDQDLIFFDEIQECSKALNSLKYFCEESNEYHITAAGSLLGVKVSREKGFPVGKVNFLNLHPLTFFEFLSALGQEKLRSFLEAYQNYEPFPEPIHEKLLQLLKVYFFVGGMPEAVFEYAQSERLDTVREIQLEILDAYERDFAKHAPLSEIMKITTVWKQVHRQLAKENKKFIFAAIRKSARGRDYEEAIQWLLDGGLIHKSHLVKAPKFPLSAYATNNIFKLFLLDVGLLGAQSNLSPQVIIDGNVLFTEFKGALTENYIAQELTATKNAPLYYWASEGSAEIDFLIEHVHEIYPLEVKAGASPKKKSLLVYDQKYTPSKLVRSTTMNLKRHEKIYNYPLYFISRCNRLKDETNELL